MAVQTGDLIQVVWKQEYLDQTVLNVHHYRYDASPAQITDFYVPFADWFKTTVVDKVRVEQVSLLYHNELVVTNLTNGVDLHIRPLGLWGLRTAAIAACLPSNVSLGFILRRSSLVTRNGYKRFGGLHEGNVNGNDYTFEGGGASQTNIENALAAKYVEGVVTLASPVIVKRPIANPATTWEFSNVSSAAFTQVGTQNTRKRRSSV